MIINLSQINNLERNSIGVFNKHDTGYDYDYLLRLQYYLKFRPL